MHDRPIRWVSRSVLGALALLGLAGSLLSACARQGGWSFPQAETWRRYSIRSGRPSLPSVHAPEPKAGSRHEAQASADADPVAQGLFARNCATCHGIDGSGQGPSVLDRPARNFRDGGFSFGNTAEALFNTISYGIPGTPMPAFELALGEEERRQLASFVRTLGPPVEDVEAADTIMTVTEETGPCIVRGILPPIVEGAPIRPRGLMIGLPGDEGGGLTFEYRIDDVRLLGVRHGGFVERTDWNDRGGTPLKPLGGVIWTDAGGDPPATFSLESGQPVTRRLTATFGSRLRSLLVTSDGETLGDVEEKLYTSHRESLNGFAQSLEVDCDFKPFGYSLTIRIATPMTAARVAAIAPADGDAGSGKKAAWHVFRRADGMYECIGILIPDGRVDAPLVENASRNAIEVRIDVPRNEYSPPNQPPSLRLVVHRLFTTEWSDSVRAQLVEGDA